MPMQLKAMPIPVLALSLFNNCLHHLDVSGQKMGWSIVVMELVWLSKVPCLASVFEADLSSLDPREQS